MGRIGMYGNMSNGNGLCDFLSVDIRKMRDLFSDKDSLFVMTYFIVLLVDNCQTYNEIYEILDIKLSRIQCHLPEMTKEHFKKCLSKLKSMKMITYKKVNREDRWLIQLI